MGRRRGGKNDEQHDPNGPGGHGRLLEKQGNGKEHKTDPHGSSLGGGVDTHIDIRHP